MLRKSKTKKPLKSKPEYFFDQVVTNSIDFFNASIRDFKKWPKYSVINFCSGLELALKARLLKEHWSLIVKRPEEAALLRFQNGDFVSVAIDDSIKRLVNVGNETFSIAETKCFERLRDHRNKVVHFCHNAYSSNPDSKLLEEVAAEQCMAWCYLHRKLTGAWFEYFKKHRKAIKRLDKKLHGHRAFLKAKFATLKSDIEKEEANGVEYRDCLACGCHSARMSTVVEPVRQIECSVCGTRDTFLRIICSKCEGPSAIDDMASAACQNKNCRANISLADVMEEYAPSPRPGDPEDGSYYCGYCEHPEKSATTLGDRYFCFWCKQWFDIVTQCEHCGGSLVGFDEIGGVFSGCFMCEDALHERFHYRD